MFQQRCFSASVAVALALALAAPAQADVLITHTRAGDFVFAIDVNNGDTQTVVPLDDTGRGKEHKFTELWFRKVDGYASSAPAGGARDRRRCTLPTGGPQEFATQVCVDLGDCHFKVRRCSLKFGEC